MAEGIGTRDKGSSLLGTPSKTLPVVPIRLPFGACSLPVVQIPGDLDED